MSNIIIALFRSLIVEKSEANKESNENGALRPIFCQMKHNSNQIATSRGT